MEGSMLQIALLSSLSCAFLLLCGVHMIYNVLQAHDCEMTWMYQRPHYPQINLSEWAESTYPQYSLHLYKESKLKVDKKLLSSPPVLQGVPALFIPGNAGSYKQVRSSASVALRMFPSEFQHLGLLPFDFFAVNLNEELSGAFGGVLERQTAFVALCIKHILSMYGHVSNPPHSVVLVTHSMGGVVAHALFAHPEFTPSTVHTIIALASPLRRPVYSFDLTLQQFYSGIHKVWSDEGGVASNVTVVSVAGGERDIQVPAYLTRSAYSINVATAAVPRNWVSADHQAVVWCRRVQLALVRSLFSLQDPVRRELVRDRGKRDEVFSHFLFTGGSVPMVPSNTQLNRNLLYMLSTDYHYQDTYLAGYSSLAIPHSAWQGNGTLLMASNTLVDIWAYQCAPIGSHMANCTDISPTAQLLPPTVGYTKYITLLPGDILPNTSHSVVKQPRGLVPRAKTRVYVLVEQCDTINHTLSLTALGGEISLVPGHCTLMNFTIPHLRELWQVYTATVASCGPITAGLVTPWYPHTPMLHSNGSHKFTQTLSLLVPPPDGVHAHFLVWAPRHCAVEVTVDMDVVGLLSKLLVLYAPFIPVWLAAVSIATPAPPLALELAMATIVHQATTANLWPTKLEWVELAQEGVWPVWAPPLLLLLARGVHQLLLLTIAVVSGTVQRLVSRQNLRSVSDVLFAASTLSLLPCSALSLVCLVLASALTATNKGEHQLLCVLLSLQFLTLPAMFTWAREIRYSFYLTPDPHYLPVLVTMAALLLRRAKGDQRSTACGQWDSMLRLLMSTTLLLACLPLAYRTSYFVALYVTITVLKQILSF